MDIQKIIEEFKELPGVSRCRTRTGAFNQCDHVSTKFNMMYRDISRVVRMTNNNGHFKNPVPQWLELPYSDWDHFAIEIPGIGIVDYTIRQFDKDLPFPYVYQKPEDIGFQEWRYK